MDHLASNLAAPDFLAGVIEGFYGEPWTQSERFELFDWMGRWGLNTYLYAPKDDLHHRVLWREVYSADAEQHLGQLIRACAPGSIRFIYGLGPGLDIRYGDEADLDRLRERLRQMLALGCRHFALLFDDLPDRGDTGKLERVRSLASAQCQVTNTMFRWTRERCPDTRFFFCPTAYCSRMAEDQVGGKDYLPVVGRELSPEIDVFWTGPEIVSPEISLAHIAEVQTVLRRKPVIWDNLHANDYDGRRFFCGPYAGRPPALRHAVRGLLSNPNNEFPLNYVPLRTLGQFVHCDGSWDERAAYRSAMREWLACFGTVTQPVTLEDLMFFGDCYYLPHQEGPEGEALYQLARGVLGGNLTDAPEPAGVFRRQSARLREFCVRMTELRQRPLFYALSRRIWELREELELLERFIGARAGSEGAEARGGSELLLPATGAHRGGLVARLQRLLLQQPDGTLIPASSSGSTPGTTSANSKSIPALKGLRSLLARFWIGS